MRDSFASGVVGVGMGFIAYTKVPILLLAGIALGAVLLGWGYTITIGSETGEVLRRHRETLQTQNGESLIPSASAIDLRQDDWVTAAQTRQTVGLVNLGYAVLANVGLLLALLWSGYSARLREFYQRVSRFRGVHWLLYAITIVILVELLNLPIVYLTSFYVPHLFKLSTITTGLWAQDFLLNLGIFLAFFVPVILVFYWLLNRFPRTWWLWLTLFLIPFFTFVTYVWPLAIQPLFNTYEPLEDVAVRAEAEPLLARTGVQVEDIYRVDLSRRTLEGNAFVSGLGSSKRIAIGDNLLDHFTPEEIAFVVGHELGHYVLGHLWLIVATDVLSAFLMIMIIRWLLGWSVRRFGHRWGITAVGDVATYPLVALVVFLVPLLSAPAFNGFSRYKEHQADVYALDLTQDPEAGITSFTKLAYQGLSVPQPPALVEFWFYTHPSIQHRIEFLEGRRMAE